MSHYGARLHQPVSPSEMLAPLATWAGNFQRNTTGMFRELRPIDYIRLLTIICGYLLLRPYIVKFGAHIQQKDHAQKVEAHVKRIEICSGSDIGSRKSEPRCEKQYQSRSQSQQAIPGINSDSEDEDEREKAGGVEWGLRARLRQRKVVRKAMAKYERQLEEVQPTESDKEIEEFLID